MYSLLLLGLLLIPLCSCDSHYTVLGIPRNAKPKEIKKAYVKLAYEWHPDKNRDNPDAPNMMAKINQAYEVLSDEDRRRHYDLIEDDSDYLSARTSSSYSSSFSSSSYEPPSDEPTDEINTKEFADTVLPASRTTPYLIYFFHDFCDRCEYWTQLLDDARKELDLIGIKMASINVIISSKVATYCGIYIHEVPKVVLLLNKKSTVFKGKPTLENLKDFVFNNMPPENVVWVNDVERITSVETRIKHNKPLVLLVSNRTSPSLNYKMAAYSYRMFIDFFYICSSHEEAKSSNILQQLNFTVDDKTLKIFTDLEKPVAILQGETLNREATKAALERNKLLSLPRVTSCTILNELCPGGPNTRLCALLVADVKNELTNEFRNLAVQWSDKKFNMGYLNKKQDSALKNLVALDEARIRYQTCKNGRRSEPILFLRRASSVNIEYSWFPEYCGTADDNSKLLNMIQSNTLEETTTMEKCMFDDEPEDSLWFMLPPSVRRALIAASEFIKKYKEKIGAFITIPLSMLLMYGYMLFRRHQMRRRPNGQRQLAALAQQGDGNRGDITDDEIENPSSEEDLTYEEQHYPTADVGGSQTNREPHHMSEDSSEDNSEDAVMSNQKYIKNKAKKVDKSPKVDSCQHPAADGGKLETSCEPLISEDHDNSSEDPVTSNQKNNRKGTKKTDEKHQISREDEVDKELKDDKQFSGTVAKKEVDDLRINSKQYNLNDSSLLRDKLRTT